MTRLADSIDVTAKPTATGRTFALTIDGEPFPWWVTGAVTTRVEDGEAPSITITIPANRVTVLNEF